MGQVVCATEVTHIVFAVYTRAVFLLLYLKKGAPPCLLVASCTLVVKC